MTASPLHCWAVLAATAAVSLLLPLAVATDVAAVVDQAGHVSAHDPGRVNVQQSSAHTGSTRKRSSRAVLRHDVPASSKVSVEAAGSLVQEEPAATHQWNMSRILDAAPLVDGLSRMTRPLLDLAEAAGLAYSATSLSKADNESSDKVEIAEICKRKQPREILNLMLHHRYKLSEAEEKLACRMQEEMLRVAKFPDFSWCTGEQADKIFAQVEEKRANLANRTKAALRDLVLEVEKKTNCRISKHDGWDRGWKFLNTEQEARNGHAACPCVHITVGDEKPLIKGQKMQEYARNVGYDCVAWDDGNYPGACKDEWDSPGKGLNWCAMKWCYVDPCNCQLPDSPTVSSFYPNYKYKGMALTYSYETCSDAARDVPINTSLYKSTDPRCSPGSQHDYEAEDDDEDLLDPNAEPPSAFPTKNGLFEHYADSKMCQSCEGVYYEMDGNDAWALVMKLSSDQFCFNSTKWTDSKAYQHGKSKHRRMPGVKEYDTKSYAFHRLQGVSELRFENEQKKSVSVRFGSTGTPEVLMTTNTIPFAEYPDWEKWKQVFVNDQEKGGKQYERAPVFMRAGETVMSPASTCREGEQGMDGCAKQCTFCFYASEGTGCPEKGTRTDDMTYGIGHNFESCNKDVKGCSVDGGHRGEGSESARIMVWAKVSEQMLQEFAKKYEPDDADVGSWESQNAQSQQDGRQAGTRYMNSILDGMEVMGSGGKLTDVDGINDKLVPVETGLFTHAPGSRMCDNCSEVLYKRVGTDMWAMLMKLSKNDFCYDSEKWTDGVPFNPEKMNNTAFPKTKEYDAKSIAFHRLNGVNQIALETSRGALAMARFVKASTPENLITTNAIQLSEHPEWASWNAALGSKANHAPMFVRGGKPVMDPSPPCRTSNVNINGCSQPCMFCFMAADGVACPAVGVGDDRATGIGSGSEGCHTDRTACSASSPNSGANEIIVWGRVPEKWLLEFSKPGSGGDAGMSPAPNAVEVNAAP